MKHLTISFLAIMCLLLACTTDSAFLNQELDHTPIEFRAKKNKKVTICHLTGNGQFKPITVSVNALPAHKAHGDYLPGDEAYCYTCTHCDVNQIIQYEWESYFDADELTCTIYTGATIWTDRISPDGNGRGISAIEFPSTGQKLVLSWLPGGSYCQRVVGVDITEEEWANCLTFIRNLISTRPDLPELCDILSSTAQEYPDIKALTTSVFKRKAIPFSSLPIK